MHLNCAIFPLLDLGNEFRFRTLVLRPTVLYGEGDHIFVPEMLQYARINSGVFPRIGMYSMQKSTAAYSLASVNTMLPVMRLP